jgi:hypothetical protein
MLDKLAVDERIDRSAGFGGVHLDLEGSSLKRGHGKQRHRCQQGQFEGFHGVKKLGTMRPE